MARHDRKSLDQIRREILYCDQELARTTSLDHRERAERIRKGLRDALQRKVQRKDGES